VVLPRRVEAPAKSECYARGCAPRRVSQPDLFDLRFDCHPPAQTTLSIIGVRLRHAFSFDPLLMPPFGGCPRRVSPDIPCRQRFV